MTKEKHAVYGSTTTATTPTNQGLGGELYLFFNVKAFKKPCLNKHNMIMVSYFHTHQIADCNTDCILFTDA